MKFNIDIDDNNMTNRVVCTNLDEVEITNEVIKSIYSEFRPNIISDLLNQFTIEFSCDSDCLVDADIVNSVMNNQLFQEIISTLALMSKLFGYQSNDNDTIRLTMNLPFKKALYVIQNIDLKSTEALDTSYYRYRPLYNLYTTDKTLVISKMSLMAINIMRLSYYEANVIDNNLIKYLLYDMKLKGTANVCGFVRRIGRYF